MLTLTKEERNGSIVYNAKGDPAGSGTYSATGSGVADGPAPVRTPKGEVWIENGSVGYDGAISAYEENAFGSILMRTIEGRWVDIDGTDDVPANPAAWEGHGTPGDYKYTIEWTTPVQTGTDAATVYSPMTSSTAIDFTGMQKFSCEVSTGSEQISGYTWTITMRRKSDGASSTFNAQANASWAY